MPDADDQLVRDCTVLVVGGSEVLVEAIASLIDGFAGYTAVAQSSGIDEILQTVAHSRPNIIVSGAHPGRLNPTELANRLKLQTDAPIPILVITLEQDSGSVIRAICQDVAGYISFRLDKETLRSSLSAVRNGLTVLGQDARLAIKHGLETVPKSQLMPGSEALSPRERQVLKLMTTGLSNKEIRMRLDIGIRTIEIHVAHILTKLKVKTRLEAVVATLQAGNTGIGTVDLEHLMTSSDPG